MKFGIKKVGFIDKPYYLLKVDFIYKLKKLNDFCITNITKAIVPKPDLSIKVE